MAILDELLKATKLKLPARPDDGFWVALVHALADESIVDGDAWATLSDTAQEWANNGMRAVKARKSKARFNSSGEKWTGEDESLEITPLVAVLPTKVADALVGEALTELQRDSPSLRPEPVVEVSEPVDAADPEPTPKPAKKKAAKRSAGKKKAAKKKAEPVAAVDHEPAPLKVTKKKAAKRAKKARRPAAFKSGQCYWFIRHFIEQVTSVDECDPELLLARFEKLGIKLKKSSANMMMYDTITVLRVLRDLKRYRHPLVKEFPVAEVPG